MTKFQVRTGLYITLFTLMFIWIALFIITESVIVIAAFEVTDMYLVHIGIISLMMKKYKCDYYIPLEFAGGVIGVKKENALNFNLYNRNMASRKLQCNYYE